MRCTHCGLEVPDKSTFCSHCGLPLTDQGKMQKVAKSNQPLTQPTAAPAAATDAKDDKIYEEKLLWEEYPSFRTAVPPIAAIVVGAMVVLVLVESYGAPGWVSLSLAGIFVLLLGIVLVRALLRLRGMRYRLTSQRIFVQHGLLSVRTDEVELEHYKDICVHQTLWDRMMGCGDIEVLTGDATNPTLRIIDVCDPIAKKEIIRTAARERKRVLGILRREEL